MKTGYVWDFNNWTVGLERQTGNSKRDPCLHSYVTFLLCLGPLVLFAKWEHDWSRQRNAQVAANTARMEMQHAFNDATQKIRGEV